MFLLNAIEVGVIWLCDWVNTLWNPFEEIPPEVLTVHLCPLEQALYEHLDTKHVVNGQFSYELPMPADAGDAALFQGLYLAMLAFKGADTTAALERADDLFIHDVLIRGRRADGTLNDTTSNDSATGMMFGLWAAKDKTIITRWAQRICDSGYALTDLNGIPTQYGQLEDGIKTDPLRLTLLLAILAVARQSNSSFDAPYFELFNKYKLLLAYPKVKLLWWDTDYDTHRAAIHLRVLWEVTGEDIYLKGLKRIYRTTAKENNAWVAALCSPAVETPLNTSSLNTFTFEDRVKGNVESINSGTVESVKWGANIRAKHTLPLYKRGSQEFFWQRNMFSLDEWVGNKQATVWHSGLDFLICYHLLRRNK